MKNSGKGLLFTKVNRTPVIPIRLKIITIFSLFLIVSNFASNYINLMYNRNHQIKLMKVILAKDLKDMFSYTNDQFQIAEHHNDVELGLSNIHDKALYELRNKTGIQTENSDPKADTAQQKPQSLFLMVSPKGEITLFASHGASKWTSFNQEVLTTMNSALKNGSEQGFISVKHKGQEYFGIYKYNSKWDAYLFRAEEYGEFNKASWQTFWTVVMIFLGITLALTIVGIFVLGYMLRFIEVITNAIMNMVKNQQLELISLKGAPNDDITYLGMAFNSLSSTIETLLQIFKKFTNKDIAYKAYKEKDIKLEGSQKELAIMFSDIKGFTTITETLGTDIIKLINLHYDRAIREIVRYDGSIGSIIGDAILAMFGTMDEITDRNKSLSAVLAAYELHAVAESLRLEMTKKKEALIRVKGGLTFEEEKVYSAVMLEIGVGIDGGEVFYGNIGSYVRMTNTVIGDNVNASSRLEGLTRIYKVPVIVSPYVKDDIENNVSGHGITFVEIDTVQVKGKTIGRKVYWPVLEQYMSASLKKDIKQFGKALKLYYDGKWTTAHREFKKANLPLAEVFMERTKTTKVPKNWQGIWAMKSK